MNDLNLNKMFKTTEREIKEAIENNHADGWNAATKRRECITKASFYESILQKRPAYFYHNPASVNPTTVSTLSKEDANKRYETAAQLKGIYLEAYKALGSRNFAAARQLLFDARLLTKKGW